MTDIKSATKSIEVKSEGGHFLFLYLPEGHEIEVHRRGLVYKLKVQDLIDFGRTSQRNVFRVMPVQPAHDDHGDIVRQGFE